jgi:hypothetical protein
MSSKAAHFLSKTLGEDFDSSLKKFELYKPGTRTTIDHEELRTALQIVPRTIMALLIRELSPMNIGDSKTIHLPVPNGAELETTKQERDVYTGQILQHNKKVVDFQYRAIPGIGLVVMSAFELYDVDQLEQKHPQVTDEMSNMVQRMVDERMTLHTLVNQVVDKKIQERDAVQQLILAKLSHAMAEPKVHVADNTQKSEQTKLHLDAPTIEAPVPSEEKVKGSPLKVFLEGRKKKKKPKEFAVQMNKGEQVHCPDCGKNIFDGVAFSGCVCLGDDRDRKVYIRKTEEGIKIRFGRGWDKENIEMLLETLWRRNG